MNHNRQKTITCHENFILLDFFTVIIFAKQYACFDRHGYLILHITLLLRPSLFQFRYNPSVCINKFCMREIYQWNKVISSYRNNEISSVNRLHERKLCSSRTNEGCFFFPKLSCLFSQY
jgi:hypothetical protein